MARKRMVSVRLAPAVADQLDARAAAAGQTRTEWLSGVVARAVLTGAGSPQPGDERVDTSRKRGGRVPEGSVPRAPVPVDHPPAPPRVSR